MQRCAPCVGVVVFVSSWTGSARAAPELSPFPVPTRWFAGAIGASMLLIAALLADARLSVDPFTLPALPILVWLCLTFGTAWAMRDGATRLRRTLRDGALDYGVFSLLALMGAVASYPVAALSHGFVDGTLQRIDAAFRFDWLSWYEVVAAHPALQWLGRLAYQSIYLSPAMLLGWFAITRRRDRARAFLAGFWLAAVITLTLFAAMPAAGPLAREWHGVIPYMPDSALWQPELIPALRDHALRRVDLGELRGLVSAPSFHTAAAVLYMRAAWPIARLRWPLLLLNAAMLLATPVEGTHYLADMMLGALVAAVSITALEALAGGQVRAARRDSPPAMRRLG